MNKHRHFLTAAFLLFGAGLAQLYAAEGDVQTTDYVQALLNNQYLLENIRLVGLAEESYSEGQYDDAVTYAQEAIKYAQLSDEYVSRQIKIRDTDEAIEEAQSRLDWAKGIGAPANNAEIYGNAENSFADAQDARSREDWDTALESARRVISILAAITENTAPEVPAAAAYEPAAPVQAAPAPETPSLPAQYLVRSWYTTRDCLWNIAAMEQIYGDPFQWRLIYEANKNKMPRPGDPDLINPGMILDIPSIKGEARSGILQEQ